MVYVRPAFRPVIVAVVVAPRQRLARAALETAVAARTPRRNRPVRRKAVRGGVAAQRDRETGGGLARDRDRSRTRGREGRRAFPFDRFGRAAAARVAVRRHRVVRVRAQPRQHRGGGARRHPRAAVGVAVDVVEPLAGVIRQRQRGAGVADVRDAQRGQPGVARQGGEGHGRHALDVLATQPPERLRGVGGVRQQRAEGRAAAAADRVARAPGFEADHLDPVGPVRTAVVARAVR